MIGIATDGVFGSLGFVVGGGVAQRHLVKFAEAVAHRTAVEVDQHLRGVGIDGGDEADVAVEDLFVVVVFGLHHLVADAVGVAEALDDRLVW